MAHVFSLDFTDNFHSNMALEKNGHVYVGIYHQFISHCQCIVSCFLSVAHSETFSLASRFLSTISESSEASYCSLFDKLSL